MKRTGHPSAATSVTAGWVYRLAWLCLAGAGFLLLYGGANRYVASLPATGVGNIALGWERSLIPFWPWTIVPYWSVDLLFVLSILVGRTRQEVRLQACRLLLITLLASICFVLWPLRFGWVRSDVGGVFGVMSTALDMIDQLFNQTPSLHIALLYATWIRLAAHMSLRWRWILHGWCSLVVLSVLTTWQHHVLDVPTGLALGMIVCYVLPDRLVRWRRWHTPAPAHARGLALRYGAGAVACVVVACLLRGWTWLALWPAFALAMLALGYGILGPAIFQKRLDGHTTVAASWLLLPYRAGAWLSWRWQRRALPATSRIVDNLLLGSRPARGTLDGNASRLDLCPELPCTRPADSARCRAVAMLDLLPPNPDELTEAVRVLQALHRQGPVLVHCALGRSRSAMTVVAWLLAFGDAADVEDAISRVSQARPGIILRPEHRRALLQWWEAWA